jgi:hypothetical protein
MTTTIAKPDRGTDRPLSHRIPSVAADLLPVEIMEVRRTRRVRRTVLVLLAACLAVLAVWYGFARVQTAIARDELADARATTQRLTKQQDAFDDLRQVQRDTATIELQLAQLMTNDMPYPTLVRALRQDAPAGLLLTGITVTLDASRTTGSAKPNGTLVAFVSISGVGLSKPQIATYVDALGKVAGVADPYITSVLASDKGLDFNIQVKVTEALLGGRFSPASKAAK